MHLFVTASGANPVFVGDFVPSAVQAIRTRTAGESSSCNSDQQPSKRTESEKHTGSTPDDSSKTT